MPLAILANKIESNPFSSPHPLQRAHERAAPSSVEAPRHRPPSRSPAHPICRAPRPPSHRARHRLLSSRCTRHLRCPSCRVQAACGGASPATALPSRWPASKARGPPSTALRRGLHWPLSSRRAAEVCCPRFAGAAGHGPPVAAPPIIGPSTALVVG